MNFRHVFFWPTRYILNYKNSFIDNRKDKQKFHWLKLIIDLLIGILKFRLKVLKLFLPEQYNKSKKTNKQTNKQKALAFKVKKFE